MQKFKYPLDKKIKNTWLISYGDLITLLITFFIMMISVESGRISTVHKWINYQLAIATAELNRSVSEKKITGIDVRQDTKGVHITIQSKGMFKEGEAVPKNELKLQLINIAKVIANLNILTLNNISSYQEEFMTFRKRGFEWNVKILVEGHTDNTSLILGSKYENNWELSAARAQMVMRILQKQLNLPPQFFAIKGYGEYKPLVENNSTQNRLLNRRIDIIINASLLKSGAGEQLSI
ncbi:MAG: flagellar motor protein MotB [Candidatus Marinimicrobia bacterium]|nr:flagellar motor protein MotB [Candidatus Neomarinimicrobiota bacterium]